MKYWIPLLMLICLVGCDKSKHVSGQEFQREYELRHAQTMVATEYLGERDGKVFLMRRTMSLISTDKWEEEVWFTEVDNLTPAFMQKLRKEEIPNNGSELTNAPLRGSFDAQP